MICWYPFNHWINLPLQWRPKFLYCRGAQAPAARSLGWLKFIQWRLMLVGPRHWTCCTSACRHLTFFGGFQMFWKICAPLRYDVLWRVLQRPLRWASRIQFASLHCVSLRTKSLQAPSVECFSPKFYVFLLPPTQQRSGIYLVTCAIKQEKYGTCSSKSPSILCTMTPPHPNPNHHISRMGWWFPRGI